MVQQLVAMATVRTLGTCLLLLAVFGAIEALTKTYDLSYRSGGVDYTAYNLYNDKIYVHTTTSIVFNTKGNNDCHLLLKRDANNYYSNVIEIVIGGWSNTQSVIRTSQQGSNRDTHKESGILSSSSYRTFWISWANNCIRVGKGSSVGSSEFMGWCGLSHAINYISIGYGFGSAGYFQFTVAQDGNWGGWGSWGSCSKSCGTGSWSRSRSCNNPAPSGGGATCSGSSSDTSSCNTQACPVNGNWGGWGGWGSCSQSCGTGTQTQSRSCNNPAPANGGASCAGSSSNSQNCNTQSCPVDGGWSTWAAWSRCACDSQSRDRSCTDPAPQHGGAQCSGSSTEAKSCSSTYCPVSCRDVYTDDVTRTNGLYTIYNSAKEAFPVFCVFDDGFGYTYISPKSPVDLDVSNLISINSEIYIRQLKTDDTQMESRITQLARYRTRAMSLQYNKHDGYQGFINAQMTPYLYLGMLPNVGINHLGDLQGYAVNGQDQSFTNCDGNPNGYFVFLFNQNNVPISTYTHDSALVRKWNTLATPTPQNQYLPDDFFTFLEVHFGGCGGYIQSNQISGLQGAAIGIRYDVACSTTVPDATRASKVMSGSIKGDTVTYTCDSPYTVVSGDAVYTCLKNGSWDGTLPTCGLNGGWTAWTSWDTCTVTCDGGTQGRTRACTNPAPQFGGAACQGSTTDQQACNTQNCPIDGGFTSWTGWDTCTLTCGTGTQDRRRTCSNPMPQYGGTSCSGDNSQRQNCNTHNCPIDGDWSVWTSWATCTVTCGGGTMDRSRTCDNPVPQYNGSQCTGSAADQLSCNTTPCPIDGGFTSWTGWDTCTLTCGTGTQDRRRTCSNPTPQYGGTNCSGDNSQRQNCNTHNCPIDGDWSVWTSWATCTVTCGGGTKDRSRTCDNPVPQYNGSQCAGSAADQLSCNTTPCPIDGSWSSWGRYSACSASCLGGYRNRTRTCDDPAPAHGGAACSGDAWETNFCNNQSCNVAPPVDGNWGSWEAWQGCSATCGTGVQRRYRKCDNPAPNHNGLPCWGDAYETNSCSPGGTCPVAVDGGWSAWSSASACSATCGDGRSIRVRYCNNPSPSNGGKQCTGDSMVLSTCKVANCTSNSASGTGSGGSGTSYAASYVNICPFGMFSCKSGYITCIDQSFVCDCDGDCEDRSDENADWANCDGAAMALCESAATGLQRLSLVGLLLLSAIAVLIGQRA